MSLSVDVIKKKKAHAQRGYCAVFVSDETDVFGTYLKQSFTSESRIFSVVEM